MNKKILKLYCISTAILFSMSGISSVISAEVNQESKCFIEPNIRLNRLYIPFLESSLENINDLQLKNFVEKITQGIKQDGVVDSKDLDSLVRECDLPNSLRGIHSGVVTGSCPCINSFIALPGLIRVFLLRITNIGAPIWGRIVGYSTFVNWNSLKENYHGCSITVNGIHKYPKGHSGFIIGFIGSTSQVETNPGEPWPDDFVFKITGLGALIIIT